MNQVLAPFSLTDIVATEVESFALTFIDDAEYEFVGGGTAVNSL